MQAIVGSGSPQPAAQPPLTSIATPYTRLSETIGVQQGSDVVKRIWTIIGVDDVRKSLKWYQALLGLPLSAPAHEDFGQIVDADGTVLLCLHEWGVEEHPPLMSPESAKPGNGLLLFFRVDDFDMALPRARALAATFAEEPHVNPNTGTREFSLLDPDGYFVSISATE
jgi:catechol 2,3-dioxygenase-like lactoylglutathione lyase family enzyme